MSFVCFVMEKGISLRLSLLSSYHPDLLVRDDPREEQESLQFCGFLSAVYCIPSRTVYTEKTSCQPHLGELGGLHIILWTEQVPGQPSDCSHSKSLEERLPWCLPPRSRRSTSQVREGQQVCPARGVDFGDDSQEGDQQASGPGFMGRCGDVGSLGDVWRMCVHGAFFDFADWVEECWVSPGATWSGAGGDGRSRLGRCGTIGRPTTVSGPGSRAGQWCAVYVSKGLLTICRMVHERTALPWRAKEVAHSVDEPRVCNVNRGHCAHHDLAHPMHQRSDLLHGLAKLADEDALNTHTRIQGSRSRLETEQLQNTQPSGDSSISSLSRTAWPVPREQTRTMTSVDSPIIPE